MNRYVQADTTSPILPNYFSPEMIYNHRGGLESDVMRQLRHLCEHDNQRAQNMDALHCEAWYKSR